MNDSPGLFLFGLVFPILEQRFRFLFYYFFLCHKIFFTYKIPFKKRGVLSFESYEDGQDISCRSMMFGASRFYGRHLLFFLQRQNIWRMELSDS